MYFGAVQHPHPSSYAILRCFSAIYTIGVWTKLEFDLTMLRHS
jgi:hypothetical protein